MLLCTGVTMDAGGVQPRPDSAHSERYTYMSKLKDKTKETPLESNPPTYEEHVKRRTGQSTPSPTNTSLELSQGAPEGKIVAQDDHEGRGAESEEEGYLKPSISRKTAAVKPAPRVDGGMQMEMATLQNPAHVGRQEAGQSLGQNATVMMPGQDSLRAGQLQPVPMGLLLRERQGVPNNTPAAPDGHLILQQPRDRRSVQGVENVAYHQYEELPNREVDLGGVVLGVGGQGGGSDGPQESPYAQIGDLERTSKRKPNPLYISGRPARRRSIEKGSGGWCSRCQDQWRGYLIPVLLFLFCVVALLLALIALTNAVSRQAGATDQGADPGGTAAQTGDTWNTSVLTSQLAAALDRIQHLEMQNQQLVAQLSILDNQTMVRQDDLQNQLQATVQQISAVRDSLQTELSQLNSSVLAGLDTVSKMEGPEGPRGFNGSQGAQGPRGQVGPAGPSGVSRLDDCEYWDHSSTSDFIGPTHLDWLRPEANHTMMGVHCSTEGGTYTQLEHRIQQQGVSEYRCVCYGQVTDANIDFSSRKCTINWWQCPTT